MQLLPGGGGWSPAKIHLLHVCVFEETCPLSKAGGVSVTIAETQRPAQWTITELLRRKGTLYVLPGLRSKTHTPSTALRAKLNPGLKGKPWLRDGKASLCSLTKASGEPEARLGRLSTLHMLLSPRLSGCQGRLASGEEVPRLLPSPGEGPSPSAPCLPPRLLRAHLGLLGGPSLPSPASRLTSAAGGRAPRSGAAGGGTGRPARKEGRQARGRQAGRQAGGGGGGEERGQLLPSRTGGPACRQAGRLRPARPPRPRPPLPRPVREKLSPPPASAAFRAWPIRGGHEARQRRHPADPGRRRAGSPLGAARQAPGRTAGAPARLPWLPPAAGEAPEKPGGGGGGGAAEEEEQQQPEQQQQPEPEPEPREGGSAALAAARAPLEMSGRGAPAAPSEDSWIAAEKGQGSPPPPPLKKKPKGGSSGLRRAFSWLRGKRKKAAAAAAADQQQPRAPPAEGAKKPQARSKGKGAAKAENEKRLSVQYKAGDERTGNAFFSSSRPPHLEELHTEAQAGLKSLQNQEKQKYAKRTWDHSDTSSLQSSRTSTEGDDVSVRSQTLSCTTETTSEDALSIRSEMIQRKGSTFRPHDSFPKSSAKGQKRRRERRTTVLGLPTHVQKELGLSNGYDAKKCPGSISVRASPTPQLLVNGAKGHGNAIHIPTIDGKMEPDAVPEGGARVSLLEVEAATDSALQGHIDRIYYDDSLLGRKTADKLSPLARPKSLAVPWLTTRPASPESLGPVMSISPQGTYLSKIIPNAVLPPLVDVIALSRNRVRTLSRCSLSTASPSPSVRSVGRFPALARSREHSSSSDNWSHSQSTETIVSNTSTISSHGGSRKGGTGPDGRGPMAPGPDPDGLSTYSSRSGASATWAPAKAAPASPHLLGVRPPGGSGSSSGRASPAYSTGSVADGSDNMSVRSDRSSARSVSLRKMKKAPAPPRRTYSLHQKAQQLEAEGAPKAMGLPPKPSRRPPREGSEAWGPQGPGRSPSLAGEDDVFSPSSPSEAGSLACSLDIAHRGPAPVTKLHEAEGLVVPEAPEVSSKHSSPDHFGRTMSPSSGYSSQSGTPTLQAKSPVAHIASPGKKGPQPKKPERICSLQSPGLSVSSSLTSLSSSASDPAPPEGAAVPPAGTSSSGPAPALSNKMDRFVIPPHPKVPAPSCLPPTKTQPPEPRRDEATISGPDMTGKELPGAPAKPSQGPSPPPSPPPAYHPPPPPAKKADGNPEPPTMAHPAPSETEADALPDSMWPPPPPPVPDAHDLSMADFPPPEESFFLPAPGAQPVATAAPEGSSLPVEEPPANQKDNPAEEDKAAVPSPSFSAMVSCKSQQHGAPDPTPLPPRQIEPPPPPLPPPPPPTPTGNPPSSAPVAHRQAHELVPASPSSPRAPPNLKKPANSPPKEPLPPLSRSKSNLMPKEDANLPIVTPSLLQMVRLRSVHLDAHGPAAGPRAPAEPNGPVLGAADGKPGQAAAPQKPIRKSLSLRVPNAASKEAGTSNPLHEAVRLKASTLSSRDAGGGLGVAAERNARKRMTLPAFSATATSSAAGEARDGRVSPLLKSPASTASFIFAKSPKKLVIETPSSPEAQANLKKNLVAELMNVSGQRSLAPPGPAPQGSGKPLTQKVPPPIAKKPSLGPGSLQSPRSPQPPGVQEPSALLPATRDRTMNKGSAGPATGAGVRNNSSAALPETPLQSPPAQDLQEEMA